MTPLPNKPRIAIACDHAGYDLKQFLAQQLIKQKISIIDLGCDSSSISVDYPDIAKKLVAKISTKKADIGIIICGSGIGVSIAANRNKKIRAALCFNVKMAELSRLHNDANVLCLGARFLTQKNAAAILKTFIATKFEGGRHDKRVAKLS